MMLVIHEDCVRVKTFRTNLKCQYGGLLYPKACVTLSAFDLVYESTRSVKEESLVARSLRDSCV